MVVAPVMPSPRGKFTIKGGLGPASHSESLAGGANLAESIRSLRRPHSLGAYFSVGTAKSNQHNSSEAPRTKFLAARNRAREMSVEDIFKVWSKGKGLTCHRFSGAIRATPCCFVTNHTYCAFADFTHPAAAEFEQFEPPRQLQKPRRRPYQRRRAPIKLYTYNV